MSHLLHQAVIALTICHWQGINLRVIYGVQCRRMLLFRESVDDIDDGGEVTRTLSQGPFTGGVNGIEVMTLRQQ